MLHADTSSHDIYWRFWIQTGSPFRAMPQKPWHPERVRHYAKPVLWSSSHTGNCAPLQAKKEPEQWTALTTKRNNALHKNELSRINLFTIPLLDNFNFVLVYCFFCNWWKQNYCIHYSDQAFNARQVEISVELVSMAKDCRFTYQSRFYSLKVYSKYMLPLPSLMVFLTIHLFPAQ